MQEFALYKEKILRLQYLEGQSQLIVVTPHYIDVLRIRRGMKAGNISEQHTGAVVGLFGLVPYKLTGGHFKDNPL